MTSSPTTPTTGGRWLVGAAIVLLALNLRVVVASLGVVLPEVRQDLSMTPTTAGVLTTLPVLCFAVIGFSSGGLVRRFGLHHAIIDGDTAYCAWRDACPGRASASWRGLRRRSRSPSPDGPSPPGR